MSFTPRLSAAAPLARLVSRLGHAVLALVLACGLVLTQTAQAHALSLLRDAETEAFLHEVTRPILEAAGVKPESVDLYLVGDPSINAFVAGGQNIFMHSGLLLQADDINQVLGVMAHETGHISGGHLARIGDGIREATGITLLTMLLGVAAVAAGAGDAGAALMMGGSTFGQGRFFAFSRVQESAADQAGATFLEKAGISGQGLIEFFEKLQEMRFRYGIQEDAYWNTHPLTAERIERLTERVQASPYVNTPPNPEHQYRFKRIQAKLAGFTYEPQRTFSLYPESDTSEFARYARAYAWHKSAEPEQARRELYALLEIRPNDPYYLELVGQVLLESGQVKEAIPYLRRAVALAPNQPLISAMLGHALLATDDPALGKEATTILEASVKTDQRNPFAWYQLGIAYGRSGDEPRAALAAAERYALVNAPREAMANARRASAGLKRGTPEWIRAQDILLTAEDQLKDMKRRRGIAAEAISDAPTP
jgi:predicted Zn-dependent protease